MVSSAGGEARREGRERALLADLRQQQRNRAYNGCVHQQGLPGGCRDEVQVRVATDGLLVRHQEIAWRPTVVRGQRGAMVLGRVMVREPVARLRKEESDSHEQGYQGARNAGAAHITHGGRITQCEGRVRLPAQQVQPPRE
ncbi:MAG: hypothetical protein H0T50_07870 [Gemmatimonadales bacterium]|nr:hypothetical protein [Gemmatimonadales bacterium]